MTPSLVTDPAVFAALMDSARGGGQRVGLVPTMGALHSGHRSLIEAAAAACDHVAVSIFVNPLQFAENEDLDAYPRRLERDVTAAGEAGAATVFAPRAEAMYPPGFRTGVHVTGLAEVLEGAARPGHFDGVATVVTKLLSLAGRCKAFFGEKDYQQLVIVGRLVEDLALPVTVIGCPTFREADGLACSSRNAYLSGAERAAATVLYRALRSGARLIGAGEVDPGIVCDAVRAVIAAEPLVAVDYVEAVDPAMMTRPAKLDGEVRLLVAARLGRTRLIDNLGAVAARA